MFDATQCDLFAAIGGVVEHLNLKAVLGIFNAAGGVDDALDHAAFIEDGELHGDLRQVGEPRGGARGLFAVAGKEIDQPIAVNAIDANEYKQQEIGCGERPSRGNEKVGHAGKQVRRVGHCAGLKRGVGLAGRLGPVFLKGAGV